MSESGASISVDGAVENVAVPKVVGDGTLVGYSRGVTLNTGDYTSSRIDVTIQLPATVSTVEQTFRECEKFVEDTLLGKVTETLEARRKKVAESSAASSAIADIFGSK